MNIDELLASLSRQNFYHLETGELKIIKIIARSGPLNLSELGYATSKYTISFDRKGVSKRLEGTRQFKGLIKQNYVYKFTINKKESKYGLTVKGLLAALRVDRFDKIYLVWKYFEFLKQYTRDEQKLKHIHDYIKSEIAILLYHNQLQGVDWTGFRYLKSYLRIRRESSHRPHGYLDLETDPSLWHEPEGKNYDHIRGIYFKNYRLCFDNIGSKKAEEVYDKLIVKEDTSQEIKSKIMEAVVLNIAATRWYEYIDSFDLKSRIMDMFEDYLITNKKNPIEDWLGVIRENEIKNKILSINW